jgi:hypothetical protein
MGNNVFRYFLEWLKLEVAPKQYMGWLDDHVLAYYAVGLSLSLCILMNTSRMVHCFIFFLLNEHRKTPCDRDLKISGFCDGGG